MNITEEQKDDRGSATHLANSKKERKWNWSESLSRVRFFVILWTVAHHAPPSMGFFRQEYWSGLPFPSPGDLPNPVIELRSPALQADALTSEPPGKPIKMWKFKVKSLSCVWLFGTPWTVAYQAPRSMNFPRQEYWSGLPFPSPGDLPNPGIEPGAPALQTDALPSEPPRKQTVRNCSWISGTK